MIMIYPLGVAWLAFAGLAPRTGRKVRRRWHRVYRRAFPAFFYLVAALFAWDHAANTVHVDPKVTIPLWFKFVSILPQAWMGLVLGYVRVRHGIGAAIALHVMHNSATVASVALLPRLAREICAALHGADVPALPGPS